MPKNIARASLLSFCISLIGFFFTAQAFSAAQAQEEQPLTVNWYHGKEFFSPIAHSFTLQTGIPVVLTNSDDDFDTDVILVPDFANIHAAADAGHFANIKSEQRDARVPSQWRDEAGFWYGVLVRLRMAAYNPDKVDKTALKSIYDLMDSKFKGRIYLLEGTYKSNRSLLATMIVQDGEQKAREWAQAVRNNAVPIWDNDMDNISRIATGECDLALVDNYYLGYMLEGKKTGKYNIPDDYFAKLAGYAASVGIAWLNQEAQGSYANVTAVAVSSSTERRKEALQFVDFLLSDKGQALLAENVFKYPVVPGIAWPTYLKDQGRPNISHFNLNRLRGQYRKADKIYRDAGWK